MKKAEKLVLEAIDTMLQSDAKLGLSMYDTEYKEAGKSEGTYEYLHGHIDEMFALKAADLVHAEGICHAFRRTHNYRYLDDPSFKTAMEKELIARAIPKEERDKALEFLPKIIKEINQEQSEWAEKDFAYNPDLAEIIEMSKPEQPLDFRFEKVEDWPNVEVEKKGSASPGRTPSDKR